MRISSRDPEVTPSEGVSWNESTMPVVRIILRDGKDERLLWLLQQFEGLFLRRQRYVVLLDTTALSSIPSAPTRHAIGKWQHRHEEETKTWCAGTAIVISSRLVRGALMAMEWVQAPPIEHFYPATRREGLDWCISTVDEAGLVLGSTERAILQSNDG